MKINRSSLFVFLSGSGTPTGLAVALAITLAVLVAFPAYAGDHTVTEPPSKEKVSTLIKQLGSDDFAARQTAADELFKMGDSVRELLRRAAKQSTDIDVRTQLFGVIKRLDRKDLESAEVHVVGLYAAKYAQYMIEPHGRRVNWSSLCTQLVEQGSDDLPTPGKRIWDLLDDQARDIASNPKRVAAIVRWTDPPPDADSVDRSGFKDCSRLCEALAAIAKRDDFYDEKYFVGLDLHPEAKELLERAGKLSLLEKWVLHRRVLEAGFPKAFSTAPFTLENATVVIHVKATARPIILVLSGYESVRWKIVAETGAQVKQVVVGGYYPQMVVGTSSPVEMYVYEDPKNVDRIHFFACERDKDNFPKLVEFIRDLTNHDITTFQGATSGSEAQNGFTIGK